MMYLALAKVQFVLAAAGCARPESKFFFIPNWWKYIPKGRWHTDALGQCSASFKFPDDIWPIALSVVDMLLAVAGFIAVISIIIAGIEYLTTMGNSEKGVSARKRIVNSLVGLAIVLVATTGVSFIGKTIGG
jgi:hypothetical protein